MRILLVNDDGPPSDVSPYFLPFTKALQAAGHDVSVVIPEKPQSWIGKAHSFGKTLTLDRVCPYIYSPTKKCPATSKTECVQHSWYILNGTPAGCTQIGLFNFEWSAADIDLVISGPNHGQNASTIYNLSSGTVGGALEGALCGKRSIALSFASKKPQPTAMTTAACSRAVNLIGWLYNHWHADVELYNINIPMVESLADRRAVFTVPSRSYWTKGSLFVEDRSGSSSSNYSNGVVESSKKRRYFQWAPELSDIREASELSQSCEDLWALHAGYISITGFRANFALAGETNKVIEEC